MITWLSLQLFQAVFATPITGEALSMVRLFGFFELFAELLALFIFLAVYIHDRITRGKESK